MRGATKYIDSKMMMTVISTHTPHAGRDLMAVGADVETFKFLLTRPMRGATTAPFIASDLPAISTHTPHAGRDLRLCYCNLGLSRFLLTRPMRGATIFNFHRLCQEIISTHTPHAGRDYTFRRKRNENLYFYSHAPCGARRCRSGEKSKIY